MLLLSAQQNTSSIWLPAQKSTKISIPARAQTEDSQLRKDHLEVLTIVRPKGLTYRTLRGALSPNRGPVAEAELLRFYLLGVSLLKYLDAGQRREIPKYARPATLLSTV
jgi:hypothetical protein